MAVAKYNIKLNKGVYYNTTFNFKDKDGAALNITSYTFKAEIRRDSDGELEKAFTCAITNATSGVMKMSMSASDTNELPEDDLVYDILAKDSANNIHRYVKGKIIISDTITDPSF
ncbi:MAG: hypothetical protein QF535_12670 [Anaerolineales bacterium]|jgi:hypothetical protein|nr:hypothetical protein [Anaerolineales bacterium]|tara:strand:- start:21 stop:365 length:345 start_codon:yes stop_codon:yes gene_type:complete